ncbi:hypothetical protein ABPG75_009219 [Micractinium tetrahymenae]
MWELVATAVAGLNAGAGLQAAIAGAPSAASDAAIFQSFASRSRMLGLLLSTVATSSCLTAYYGESRGALWLAAAAGVGIGLPFNLLLMNPPAALLAGGAGLEPYSPRVRFAEGTEEGAEEAAAAAAAADTGATAGGSAFENAAAEAPALPSRAGVLSAATAAPVTPRRQRLMYSKSGVLVSGAELAASWSKRCWFSAALSLTAFACMMAMLGSGKDAATYGYAPY